MVEALLILTALIPAVLSLLLMRKAEVRARAQFRAAMNPSVSHRLGRFYGYPLASDHRYVEGVGYIFGDLTCRFNARSPYIRCAVNPAGPCKDCPHYESIDLGSEDG
ncbi:DUF6464 family protein [Leptothermofonsia sp. ETS-13]|uniref:DUF6464 family protein n=1 Tax=Leptothermofonsia sp. ETS-13 TaxID=3035696 RepID=UPI003B9F019B